MMLFWPLINRGRVRLQLSPVPERWVVSLCLWVCEYLSRQHLWSYDLMAPYKLVYHYYYYYYYYKIETSDSRRWQQSTFVRTETRSDNSIIAPVVTCSDCHFRHCSRNFWHSDRYFYLLIYWTFCRRSARRCSHVHCYCAVRCSSRCQRRQPHGSSWAQ